MMNLVATSYYLDRVKEGNEKAVFLHEVGGHIGFDNIIPLKIQLKIANQIIGQEKRIILLNL